jgi:hypothetical protein
VSSIDQASLAHAKDMAKRTDTPQPVKDTAGKVVYYVTPSGTVLPSQYAGLWNNTSTVTPKATDPATGITYSRDALGNVTGVEHPGDRKKDEAAAKAQAAAQAQQSASDNALKLNGANLAHGWVWVNGQQATIVGFGPDGSPIVNYAGGGLRTTDPKTGKVTTDPKKPNGDVTVFSGLTVPQDVKPDSIFNMSTGPADVWSGNTLAGNGIDRPGGQQVYGPGDHSQSANTVSSAKNQMTVAQGVQWFLNLSVQHPDLYKHLVDQLKATHYITPYTGDQVYGGYSSVAAEGMAKAMADLAQVNTTPGGANVALADFLAQKQQAAQDQASATAPKATRNYQDPATLSYVAKQAAQAALGRALTPNEEAAFERSFRAKENGYYDQVDATNAAQAAAGIMGQSGPTTGAPAPDTSGEAQAYVQGDQFGSERNAYSALEFVKGIESFLTGGGKL